MAGARHPPGARRPGAARAGAFGRRGAAMAGTTRERIVESSAELFRRQGYNATAIKQIVASAGAPFGSLYHFFPGGKAELGAEVIRTSGAAYLQLLGAVAGPAPDVATG